MILIDQEKCIGCGACVKDCINTAIGLEEGKAKILHGCFKCMHCIAVCPVGAVSTDDPDYAMSDVIPFDKETCQVPAEQMLNTIKCRRSIRQFTKQPVEKEKLELLLEAGRFSPTGSNTQNVRYIVIQDKRDEFSALAMKEFRSYNDPEKFPSVFPPPFKRDRINFADDEFLFKGAGTIILTVCPRDDNAAIASANMELVANGLGLGMLYIGFFVRIANANPALREYLGLSETDHVATAMSIGYPDVTYYRSVPRKPAKVTWI